tara:strand:- start:263 stop:469 length:207 start_codon:yes stop_codon:yes gene_type:complete
MSGNWTNDTVKQHEDGGLQEKIKELIELVTAGISMFAAAITVPSMPIIFYLTILYNVMIVVWEKFRDL